MSALCELAIVCASVPSCSARAKRSIRSLPSPSRVGWSSRTASVLSDESERTASSVSPVARASSSVVGIRPSFSLRSVVVLPSRDRSAVRLRGTRTGRPCRAIAACTACRIHHTAYEMNFTPRSGSNFRAAVISPRFPSPIKSTSGTPRFWNFLATDTTKRTLWRASRSWASTSPLNAFRASSISCSRFSRGTREISSRYRSRLSRPSSTARAICAGRRDRRFPRARIVTSQLLSLDPHSAASAPSADALSRDFVNKIELK